eukprot:jgi/Mesen1/9035/ME000566S08454
MSRPLGTPLYWCHQCNRTVRPTPGEDITCSICHGGFLEEVEEPRGPAPEPEVGGPGAFARVNILGPGFGGPPVPLSGGGEVGVGSHGIFAGLQRQRAEGDPLNRAEGVGPLRGRRGRGINITGNNGVNQFLEAILHEMQNAQAPQAEPSGAHGDEGGNVRRTGGVPDIAQLLRDQLQQVFGGHVQLMVDNGTGAGPRRVPGTFGDYLIGPGLEQLIQQLSENDPNRYGTPPASKAAVQAMPTIVVGPEQVAGDAGGADDDGAQCAVCKDTFEAGCHARQMPCKHLYHPECILPWLEEHNS